MPGNRGGSRDGPSRRAPLRGGGMTIPAREILADEHVSSSCRSYAARRRCRRRIRSAVPHGKESTKLDSRRAMAGFTFTRIRSRSVVLRAVRKSLRRATSAWLTAFLRVGKGRAPGAPLLPPGRRQQALSIARSRGRSRSSTRGGGPRKAKGMPSRGTSATARQRRYRRLNGGNRGGWHDGTPRRAPRITRRSQASGGRLAECEDRGAA